MSAVRDRKRKMVAGLVDIHVANFKASGAELIMGSAKFTGPKTLEVSLNEGGTRIVQGEKIVIGTGTRATIADIPGLRESNPLTHIEALELDYLPTASHRPWRRLYRFGTRTGDAPLRQFRDDCRSESTGWRIRKTRMYPRVWSNSADDEGIEL